MADLRLIDDCLVVLWLEGPDGSDDVDEDELALAALVAPGNVEAVEAIEAAEATSVAFESGSGELEVESDELSEVGLLHGLLGFEFSLEATEAAPEAGRYLGYGLCHSYRPSSGRSLSKSKFQRFLESASDFSNSFLANLIFSSGSPRPNRQRLTLEVAGLGLSGLFSSGLNLNRPNMSALEAMILIENLLYFAICLLTRSPQTNENNC